MSYLHPHFPLSERIHSQAPVSMRLCLVRLINPITPMLIFRIQKLMFLALIPHDREIADVLPFVLSTNPSGLAHEAHQRLLLSPTLLGCDIGQVGGTVASALLGEVDPNPVGAELPVHSIVAVFEVSQKSDSHLEGR